MLSLDEDDAVRWVMWAAEMEEQNGGFPGVTGAARHLRKLQPRPSWYAGAEELQGRMRAPTSLELFKQTSDRAGHDSGDEDRKER